MVIFIDESGTHKQSGHATTAVVYIQVPHLESVEQKILAIEKTLKIESFHWGEERWQVREKFLSAIINLEFTAKVAVFENPVHPDKMIELIFRHLITEQDVWFNKLKKKKKLIAEFLFNSDAVEPFLPKQ